MSGGPGLHDGDPMKSTVELSVAAAIEAMALPAAGRDRDGRDAGMPGKAGLIAEPLSARSFSNELGGGQRAAPVDVQPFESVVTNERRDLGFEAVALADEPSQPSHQRPGDPNAGGLLQTCQALGDLLKPAQTIESSGGDLKIRIEIVKMPPQPILIARAFSDEVLAMVEQKLDLQAAGVKSRARKLSIPSRTAARATLSASMSSDLPRSPATPARTRHQLRSDADDPLAAAQEKPLKASGHVPAVLDRKRTVVAERSGPDDELIMAVVAGLDRLGRDHLSSRRCDGYCCVAALVWIDPDHDHAEGPFVSQMNERTVGGQTSVGADATLLSSHARRSSDGGGRHNLCWSVASDDTTAMSQPVASPRTNRQGRTSPARRGQG